jgi:hypothetical protein
MVKEVGGTPGLGEFEFGPLGLLAPLAKLKV